MKIKKVKQAVGVTGTVVNTLNISGENYVPNVDAVNKQFTYSTEEQRIGTWINRKPLYRKVVNQMIGPSWTEVDGISDIEHCISVQGYLELNQNEEFIIPYTASGPTTNGLWFSISKTTHTLRQATNNPDYYDKNMLLIVEYTKTTD